MLNKILEGKRVIVIAHSQGNLFANAAVENVIAENPEYAGSIGIIGVATPAVHVVGSNVYVTAHDDRVIDALRLVNTVLESNIENDPGVFGDNRDFLNHGFTESYFDSALASRGVIDAAFNALIQGLTFPESALGDGAIKVTLEWGAEPDVDLHVYEPGDLSTQASLQR